MKFWNSFFSWSLGLALALSFTPARAAVDVSVADAGDLRTNIEPTFGNYTASATNIRHVVYSGGSDSNVGDADHPWATIKHAVLTMQAGQTLYVHSGVYSEQVNFDGAQDGTEAAPITIMAADGGARPIIKPISSPSSNPHDSYYIFRPSRSYWIIDGLVFDLDQKRAVALRITSGDTATTTTAHHILVRNCDIHNGQGPAAISTAHASDIFIENNNISINYRPKVCDEGCAPEDPAADASTYTCEAQLCKGPPCTSHSDCSRGYYCEPVASNPDAGTAGRVCRRHDDLHAVEVAHFSQNVTIEQNQLYDNSGDGVQCNGPLYGDVGEDDTARPTNVTFLNNEAYATSASYGTDHIGLFGTTENAVDIKDCDHVTVQGGHFHGFRGVGKDDNGAAITTHNESKTVKIDQVDAWDSCIGLSMGSSKGPPPALDSTIHDFVVRRSVFHDMASSCAKRYGFVFTAAEHVDAYHNVFSNINGTAVSVGDQLAGTYCTDIDIWNSIFYESNSTAIWLSGNGSNTSNVETDYNLFYNSSDGASSPHFVCNSGTPGEVTAWQNCTGGGGLTTREPDHSPAPHVGNPNFVNLTASSWDFHTQAGPARDTADATPGIPDTHCGSGPDKGRFESDCDADVWTERGTTGFQGNEPSMRLDSTGKPVVAWTGVTSSYTALASLEKWTGTSWQLLATATPSQYAHSPALALDAYDTPFVAWLEWNSTTSVYDIHVQKWTGTAWQAIGGAISALPGNTTVYDVSMELDALGNPVVAFNEWDGTAFSGYVYRWDSSLNQWLAVGGALDAISGSNSSVSRVALQLNSGNPVVAWSEVVNGGPASYIYVQQWNGSAWQSYGGALTANTSSPRAVAPSLRLYAGNPVVAFSDVSSSGSAHDLFVKKWSGSAWIDVGSSLSAVAGSGTNAYTPALALDGSGNPTVAWSEATSSTSNYKMYVQHWNSSAWVPLVGDLTGTGTASTYVSTRASLEYYGSNLSLAWDASSSTASWWYLYHTGP